MIEMLSMFEDEIMTDTKAKIADMTSGRRFGLPLANRCII